MQLAGRVPVQSPRTRDAVPHCIQVVTALSFPFPLVYLCNGTRLLLPQSRKLACRDSSDVPASV